jgi:hypothetical protein
MDRHAKIEEAKERRNNLKAQLVPMVGTHTLKEMGNKVGISPSLVRTLLCEEGLKSGMKRGRKRNPEVLREGICVACGGQTALDKNQAYRIKVGKYGAVCSKECLLARQRAGGLHTSSKFKSGPAHLNWVDGRGSTAVMEQVIDHLVKHGDAPAPAIRAAGVDCSDAVLSRARRKVGIEPKGSGPVLRHGYYSNVAKETRQLINSIKRYIKEGASQ